MVPLEPLALDSLSLMTGPPTNNTETTVQQQLQKYFETISTPTPCDNTGQVYDSAVVNIESAPETSLLASSPCKDTPTPILIWQHSHFSPGLMMYWPPQMPISHSVTAFPGRNLRKLCGFSSKMPTPSGLSGWRNGSIHVCV